MKSVKKKRKKKSNYWEPYLIGAFIVFAGSAIMTTRFPCFRSYTILAWGVLCFIGLIIFFSGFYKIFKPQYCPKCQKRLSIPFFNSPGETVKLKCKICGYIKDTGVELVDSDSGVGNSD
ncbi:MAG: hypothetical protein GY845_22380 [Planctomycetes bacterium]|nr:hypothetical protein [Planctomycetota bacterium]